MNWRGQKLEKGLEKSRKEMRICRKAVAVEKRCVSEAFKWFHQLYLRIGEGERVKNNTKIKGLATGSMLLSLIEAAYTEDEQCRRGRSCFGHEYGRECLDGEFQVLERQESE